MIDWHCHLLPGLDDGPAAMDEAVEMAAILWKAGFGHVYCTPHLIKGCFAADNGTVLAALAALQARLKAEDIAVQLLPGREHYLDEFFFDYLKDPLLLGETNHILLEIPNFIAPEVVKETCFRIKRNGFVPMIAHPERCALFAPTSFPSTKLKNFFSFKSNLKPQSSIITPQNSKLKAQNSELSLLPYLQELGCAFQGNLGSFIGWYGPQVQQTANFLKANNIYTHFGTDAHSIQGVLRLPMNP